MASAQRIAELETELTEVRDAIRKIVTGGQAYGAEGRTMTRADLKVLQEREDMLRAKLTKLRRGSVIRTYGVIT